MEMIEHTACRRLKRGEVVLFLNFNNKLATFVDSEGGVHKYWCNEYGSSFDVKKLMAIMREGLLVRMLDESRQEKDRQQAKAKVVQMRKEGRFKKAS